MLLSQGSSVGLELVHVDVGKALGDVGRPVVGGLLLGVRGGALHHVGVAVGQGRLLLGGQGPLQDGAGR